MYRITFVLSLFKGERDRPISHKALQTLLMALMYIDMLEIQDDPTTPLLFKSGVKYMEEPPGREDWQDVRTTLAMQWGDCEDLACWRAAELRVRYGIEAKPCFTWKLRENGGYLYHIQVLLPDGRIEDPSRTLGMR